MSTHQVIIATQDAAQRRRLARIIESLPDFNLLSCTTELMDTYTEVELHAPGAVLIAETLAVRPEFEVMRALFATLGVRWLVVSNREGKFSQAGAGLPGGSDLFAVSCNSATEEMAIQLRSLTRSRRTSTSVLSSTTVKDRPANGSDLILIGSSTGGVDALIEVLRSFPKQCPPTLIVQHTGRGFGQSLADLLDRQSQPRVALAEHDMSLTPGLVAIGAGLQAHVTFAQSRDLRLQVNPDEPVCGHMPSIDVMFSSALPFAQRIRAAVLTGMGRDGANGLKKLRDAGARSFAQDEKTSVVYGMPRAAVEAGGAEKSLPITEIGQALLGTHQARLRA